MKLAFDPVAKTLDLHFPDPAARNAGVQTAHDQEALHLELPEPARVFQTYRVRFQAPGEADVECRALAVQLFEQGPGGSSATFQVESWQQGEASAADRPVPGLGSELSSTPAIFRIQQMQVPERMRLAAKADRNERAVLLRDSSPQVLQGLLNNPRLSSEDVLRIARSTHASGVVLNRIAADPRWAANPEIQTALARNPKTPSPLAIRLIEVLRTSDLRTLAKMQGIKENLRRAALRVYLKRTGQG